MKIYTCKNPYHCDLCGKEFIFRNHIKRLMKSHARDNSYRCTLCGRRFISRNHPMRCMNSHTDKNPYHCALCGKGFISRNQIKRRMMSHYAESISLCSLWQVIDLKNHVKSLAWENPYQEPLNKTQEKSQWEESTSMCAVCGRNHILEL